MKDNIIYDKKELFDLIEENKFSIYGGALQFASEELKSDKEVVLKAIKGEKSRWNLSYASEELQDDNEIVLEAVRCTGEALKYASERLKKDKKIVLEAIKEDGDAIEFASEELRNDKEVVLEAIKHGSKWTLRYAGAKLQNDQEVVLEAIKVDGDAIEFASEELKNDKYIVLKAIKESKFGRAGHFVGETLQNDKEVVLAILQKDGDYLYLASEEMKNNKEVVLAAVRQSEDAFYAASEELQKDSDVLKIVNNWKKSKRMSSIKIQDDETNKIIIITEDEKDIKSISKLIIKKYPNNKEQIDKGTYKNILYFEQNIESEYDIIDIGVLFEKIKKVLDNKGIIISKLESDQTGMMELEYYFGTRVNNIIYDNCDEYYDGLNYDSYFNYDKKEWLKYMTEEVKTIVDRDKDNLTSNDITVLNYLNII